MYKDIQEKFNENSQNYDSQRKKLIPCFEDFYNISTSIAEAHSDTPKILDIGAGTGIFSEYILKKYPKASLTLIDISENMLEMAKIRFKDFSNIKYIAQDYSTYNFHEKYDIIISSLSIHHLLDEEKVDLFTKCYSILSHNGMFINSDQFLGETPYIEELNKRLWKANIEKSDLSNEEILSCYERMKLDKEATLDQHLAWFKTLGFKDVSCVYKYYHFGVIFGKKIS